MLKKNQKYLKHRTWVSNEAKREIDQGLALLSDVKQPIVSFFGSHMVSPLSPRYKHCERVAYELGKKGYAVVTGGGPGFMYAANTGAFKAGVPSIGIRASLIKNELVDGAVYTKTHSFKFLFVRRFILSIKSEAIIFYPGGFGTLNELFEYVVLIQTTMVDEVPIILVDKKFWKGLFSWVDNEMIPQNLLTHGKKDLELFHFVDDVGEIVKIIEKSRKKK